MCVLFGVYCVALYGVCLFNACVRFVRGVLCDVVWCVVLGVASVVAAFLC